MKKVLTSVVTMLFLFATFIPSVSSDTANEIKDVTVTIDHSTKRINISGETTSGEGKEVTAVVMAPNGIFDYVDQTISETDGKFHFSYITNSGFGEYEIKLGGDGIAKPFKATAIFSKTPENTNFKDVMTVVDHIAGVTITGNSEPAKQVTVIVYAPNGNIDYLNQTKTDEHGYFQFVYKTNASEGVFHVKLGGENLTSYESSFELKKDIQPKPVPSFPIRQPVAPEPEPEPEPEPPIAVEPPMTRMEVTLVLGVPSAVKLSEEDLQKARQNGLNIVTDSLSIDLPKEIIPEGSQDLITIKTVASLVDLMSIDTDETTDPDGGPKKPVEPPKWAESVSNIVQFNWQSEDREFVRPVTFRFKSEDENAAVSKLVQHNGEWLALPRASAHVDGEIVALTSGFSAYGVMEKLEMPEWATTVQEDTTIFEVTGETEGDIYYTTNTKLVEHFQSDDLAYYGFTNDIPELDKWNKYEDAVEINPGETAFAVVVNDGVYSSIEKIVEPEATEKENVEAFSATKEWKITFNQEVNRRTVTEEYIYVTDKDGSTVAVELTIDDEDKNKVIVSPVEAYTAGETYTLHISQEMKGKGTNRFLTTPIKMTFTIE